MTEPPSGRVAVVAVLDYPGPSMPARTKAVLLPDTRLACTYPFDAHRPCTAGLPGYASDVSRRLPHAPHVIVAYCAAGAVARELANRYPITPRLVLVNPEQPEPDQGARALASFLEEAGAARPDGLGAGWLGDDVSHEEARQALSEQHLHRLEQRLGAARHLRPIADELATLQIEWVYHLTAAARSVRDIAADELHVVSADHPCAPECAATHEVMGMSEDDVFSDTRLGDAIAAAASRAQPSGYGRQ
jgi:hypothetical protein